MPRQDPLYSIEFYESPSGDKPVLRWINENLTASRRRMLGYAIFRVLQRLGIGVCRSQFGRQLGGGLFEFRVQARPPGESEVALLRIFCHATGGHIILLLAAYDKGADPSPRRQSREIAVARQRLADFEARVRASHKHQRES